MTEFNPTDVFSKEAQKNIVDVSNSVDDFVRLQEASDKSNKLHSIILLWSKQQGQERALRRLYAICFIIGG